MRLIAFIVTCLFAVAALAASNHADPFVGNSIVVEAHSPGPWLFNQADYQRCVTIQMPPLKEPISIQGVPVVQPTA